MPGAATARKRRSNSSRRIRINQVFNAICCFSIRDHPRESAVKLSTAFASLLAADLDGATAAPAGSPEYFMDIDPSSGALNIWNFHFDPTTPGNSTFTGPTSVSGVAPFTAPCPNTQDCLPQPGTTQNLDALGDCQLRRS